MVPALCFYAIIIKKGGMMEKTSKILIILGILVLVFAVLIRLPLGRPYSLIGVRALSLITISNTLFLLAIILKIFAKK